MDSALFRITLRHKGKRPLLLSKLVAEDTLSRAVLCAQQWTIWSNASGRGKLAKYGEYSVEARNTDGVWCEAASGSLAEARQAWTKEDEARIDAEPMVLPVVGHRGTTKRRVTRARRTARVGKSRLAQFVEKTLAQKE